MQNYDNTDDQLRITSAQRERAVELVRQAAADGRLDFDEMNGRVAVGLEAKTQGELRRIVGDLVPSAELAAFLLDVTPALEGPGSTWDNPLMLGKDKKSLNLHGRWQVPPFMELYCSIWHSVKINFMEAVALAPVIDLVVVAHGGSPRSSSRRDGESTRSGSRSATRACSTRTSPRDRRRAFPAS